MKNILIGNGINIEYGGVDYLNSSIIKRVVNNLRTKDYSELFCNEITSEELLLVFEGMYNQLKSILEGRYNKFCDKYYEYKTLERFKQQYNLKTKIFDVGMEDYFFILRLYHKRFNDSAETIKASFDGFCWIFLDAIYNDGRIQNIWENISDKSYLELKNKLHTYNNIYTVNYDQNIQMIADKKIHYLHGDFSTLLDQYDSSTLIGKLYQEKKKNISIKTENSHIYCNAIMGFIGSFKERQLEIFQNCANGLDQVINLINNGISVEDNEKIERLKQSEDKKQRFAYDMIEIYRKHPELKIREYPYTTFKELKGELHIVGLSPNNDDHIWKILNENIKINKIVYYYKSKYDQEIVDNLYSHLNIDTKPVSEFW